MKETKTLEVIGNIDRNRTEIIRASICEYNGARMIDVRTWYTGPDDILRPTQKGIFFKAELLPALLVVLEATLKRNNELQPVKQ